MMMMMMMMMILKRWFFSFTFLEESLVCDHSNKTEFIE